MGQVHGQDGGFPGGFSLSRVRRDFGQFMAIISRIGGTRPDQGFRLDAMRICNALILQFKIEGCGSGAAAPAGLTVAGFFL